jgi:DNA invertase Pin-like site-specific DNA recombinase
MKAIAYVRVSTEKQARRQLAALQVVWYLDPHAFNLLNTANYSQIGRIINASDYGQVDSQLPPRQLQFGAKVTF